MPFWQHPWQQPWQHRPQACYRQVPHKLESTNRGLGYVRGASLLCPARLQELSFGLEESVPGHRHEGRHVRQGPSPDPRTHPAARGVWKLRGDLCCLVSAMSGKGSAFLQQIMQQTVNFLPVTTRIMSFFFGCRPLFILNRKHRYCQHFSPRNRCLSYYSLNARRPASCSPCPGHRPICIYKAVSGGIGGGRGGLRDGRAVEALSLSDCAAPNPRAQTLYLQGPRPFIYKGFGPGVRVSSETHGRAGKRGSRQPWMH